LGDVYNGWVDGGVGGCGWDETDGLMVGRWGGGVKKSYFVFPTSRYSQIPYSLFPVPRSLFPT